MISVAKVWLLAVSVLIQIGFPLVLFIYLYKRERISIKAVFIGAVIWVVFTQLLERPLHIYLLQKNPFTMDLFRNPIIFSIYGSLAAGIFEEGGRFLAFTLLLRKLRKWKDGVAYGLGHGGVESILIGLTALQSAVFAFLLYTGSFDIVSQELDPEIAAMVESQLLNTPTYMMILGGFERIAALFIQIALSLVVLYGVKEGKFSYLFIAVLIHALIDFPVALYQSYHFNSLILMGMLLVFAVLSFIYIIRSERRWDKYFMF